MPIMGCFTCPQRVSFKLLKDAGITQALFTLTYRRDFPGSAEQVFGPVSLKQELQPSHISLLSGFLCKSFGESKRMMDERELYVGF